MFKRADHWQSARLHILGGCLAAAASIALVFGAEAQTGAPTPTAAPAAAPAASPTASPTLGGTAPAIPATMAPPSAAAATAPVANPAATAPVGEAVHSEVVPETKIGDVPAAVPAGAPHAGPAALPHDLSPWGMFMAADMIVKGVMSGLAFASLVTWTVGLAKALELMFAKRRLRSGLIHLASSPSLRMASEAGVKGRVAQFVAAALGEAERSAGLPVEGIKERALALLTRLEHRAGRAMTRGTGVLATIGATAPFVGLFGTVWGIMNSFIGISKANTTNLAVVAPGIAEALLATAIGLVAAIPAVVIYNLFAKQITGYKALLADAGTEVMRHLSRDLDRQLYGAAEDEEGRVVMMRRSAE